MSHQGGSGGRPELPELYIKRYSLFCSFYLDSCHKKYCEQDVLTVMYCGVLLKILLSVVEVKGKSGKRQDIQQVLQRIC